MKQLGDDSITEQQAREMIKRVDKDGDCVINYDGKMLLYTLYKTYVHLLLEYYLHVFGVSLSVYMGGGRRTEFNFNHMTAWKLTCTGQKEISVSEMNQVFAKCLQTQISFHVSFIYPCINLIIYSSIHV